MFPNREQFGRPIGPMGFAINTVHNPPLPPPPPPIFSLPTQPTAQHSPPPPPTQPPTQPQGSLTGWTPTHPPPGSFCSPGFPPSPPSTGLSTSMVRYTAPAQGTFTPPAPSRPMTPSRMTTPQSLGFHEDAEHWDAKAKFGLKLLKRVASTPYSQKAGISGCPIEQVPVMAIIRHGWSSYWLRYLSNGQEMFPVMSKSIADAVLASELLSMIRQRKINTDAAATAYAWEHSLPMDRTSAVKALAEDFRDYMEDLIHKRHVANNASNSAQQTMSTPAAVQAAAQGANPASSHRITQLEVQLANAQHTIRRMQANAPGQASLGPAHRAAEPTEARGSTVREQIDRLTQEVGLSRTLKSWRYQNPFRHPRIPLSSRHREDQCWIGTNRVQRNPTQPKEETDVHLASQYPANIRRNNNINPRDRGIGLHTSPSKEVAASNTHRQTNTGSETGRRDLQHPRAALSMVHRQLHRCPHGVGNCSLVRGP